MNVSYYSFSPGKTMLQEITYSGKCFPLRSGKHKISDMAVFWGVDEDTAAAATVHGMTQVAGCRFLVEWEDPAPPEVPVVASPEPPAAPPEPEPHPKRVRTRKGRKKS